MSTTRSSYETPDALAAIADAGFGDKPKRNEKLLARFSGDPDATIAFLMAKKTKKTKTPVSKPAAADLELEAQLAQLEWLGFGARPGRNRRLLKKFGTVEEVVTHIETKQRARQQQPAKHAPLSDKDDELKALAIAGFGNNPQRNKRMLKQLGSVEAVLTKLVAHRTAATKYTSQLKELKALGFNQRGRNIKLLEQFDGSVEQVAARLLEQPKGKRRKIGFEAPPELKTQLDTLHSAGFGDNVRRNVRLLNRFDGNVDKVVGKLYVRRCRQATREQFTPQLEQLASRGFDKRGRNLALLKKFDGSADAVAEFLTQKQARQAQKQAHKAELAAQLEELSALGFGDKPGRNKGLLRKFDGSVKDVVTFLLGRAEKSSKKRVRKGNKSDDDATAEEFEFAQELVRLDEAGFGDKPRRNIRLLRRLGSVEAVIQLQKRQARLERKEEFASELQQLAGLGHTKKGRNLNLLIKFEGNVEQVVQVLSRSGESSAPLSDEDAAALRVLSDAGFGNRPGRNLGMLRRLGSVEVVLERLRKRRQVDPKYASQLEELSQLGFKNPVRCSRLLTKFDGSVEQVAAFLTNKKDTAASSIGEFQAELEALEKAGFGDKPVRNQRLLKRFNGEVDRVVECLEARQARAVLHQKYASQLEQLGELGFGNKPGRNLGLLNKFNGSVEDVVAVLRRRQKRQATEQKQDAVEAALMQMKALGFNKRRQNLRALKECGGDVDLAASLLRARDFIGVGLRSSDEDAESTGPQFDNEDEDDFVRVDAQPDAAVPAVPVSVSCASQ